MLNKHGDNLLPAIGSLVLCVITKLSGAQSILDCQAMIHLFILSFSIWLPLAQDLLLYTEGNTHAGKEEVTSEVGFFVYVSLD